MTEPSPTTSSLPAEYCSRLRSIYQTDDYAQIVACTRGRKAQAFRVNTLRADIDQVVAKLEQLEISTRAVQWFREAFVIDLVDRKRLLDTDLHASGSIYFQNLSSMVPVIALDVQPHHKVLDLCAAPGSKTLQIASRIGGDGEVAAVEVVKRRYYKLRDNLKRHGAPANVRVYHQDGTRAWRYRPEYFDRVLVDAPCSSEGRFDTEVPKTTAYWSLRKIKEMQRKQLRLLSSARACLKPGGRIVYATCTHAPEENEVVLARSANARRVRAPVERGLISSQIEELPNVRPALTHWEGEGLDLAGWRAFRILPTDEMEGFFVAVGESSG